MTRIICYGAGYWFDRFMEKVDRSQVEIIAVADKNAETAKRKLILYNLAGNAEGGGAISPGDIYTLKYDFVVICSDDYAEEMTLKLLDSGVPRQKICYAAAVPFSTNGGLRLIDAAENYLKCVRENNEKANPLLLGGRRIRDRFIVNDCLLLYHKRRLSDFYAKVSNDYVRKSTLELMSNQIIGMGVKGEIAELGVWKGEFAALMNELLPDRDLYLFDTFDGYSDTDLNQEKSQGILDSERYQALKTGNARFRNIDINLILGRMPYAGKCIIKKGYFPETAIGMDEGIQFSLVSIDVNLYTPTYEGLKYFYPRLSKGGYIMVHDYNHIHCAGVKEAVDKFCSEYSVTLIPVSDMCGTAVIAK